MTAQPIHEGRAGDVGQYAGPAHPEFWITERLGHSRPSHKAFGWCCLESDRSVDEEVWAWRLKYQRDQADA